MLFSIISVGHNCQRFVKHWYKSIISQTYPNWECIVAIDPSSDKTIPRVKSFTSNNDKFKIIVNDEHLGASHNRYNCTKLVKNKESIIVHLDLDDKLYHKDVLTRVKYEYDKYNCWVTYGSYICSNGIKDNWNKSIPNNVWENNSHRKHVWSTTALRTFKKWLWDKINYEDFIYNGQWIEKGTDMACMWPMIEMAGKEKVRYIKDILYFYNIYDTQRSISRKQEAKIEKYIRSIKPYKNINEYES